MAGQVGWSAMKSRQRHARTTGYRSSANNSMLTSLDVGNIVSLASFGSEYREPPVRDRRHAPGRTWVVLRRAKRDFSSTHDHRRVAAPGPGDPGKRQLRIGSGVGSP